MGSFGGKFETSRNTRVNTRFGPLRGRTAFEIFEPMLMSFLVSHVPPTRLTHGAQVSPPPPSSGLHSSLTERPWQLPPRRRRHPQPQQSALPQSSSTSLSNMTAPQPESQPQLPKAESVRVVIQGRPLLPFELAHNAHRAVSMQSQPPLVHVNRPISSAAASRKSCGVLNSGSGPIEFSCFDAVYDAAPGSAPDSLYDQHVSPLINTLFTGINATVFAYGQTCAGKSYTMRHITSRAAAHIFEHKRRVEAEGSSHVAIRIGFVEIYRESIRDLVDGASAPLGAVHVHVRARAGRSGGGTASRVNPNDSAASATQGNNSSDAKANVNDGKEAEKRGVFLDGARERCVDTERALIDIVEEGALVRRTAATGMNASSSRSHSIITISVFQEPLDSSTQDKSKCLYSKIHLVDLAGSERAKRTAAGGERFAEGVDINKGLFALAKVISTLADNAKRPASRRAHVPYRESKLTRLLQDSLGGSARTVLIACVSPADSSTEETLGTLRYAERARLIRNQPKVNKEPNAVEVSDLRAALSRARAKIAALAADNERIRSASKCPSCSKPVTEARTDSELAIKTSQLTKVKTTPLSPSGDLCSSIPSMGIENGRLTRRPLTSRPLQQIHSPHRTMHLTKLPRRAPRVGVNRRRSQSANASRARSRWIKQPDVEEMAISPSVRPNMHRKRMRMNNVSCADEQVDDFVESDSSSASSVEHGDDDDEVIGEETATTKSLSRSAATTLTNSSLEEMRRTFTERLKQAETDKAAIDAERNQLLQKSRETEERHQQELEQVRTEAVARLSKLRAKLADIKRLEAERTRLNKLRDGSDAARKRLQSRVTATERSRNEAVSRLTEALSRTELSKMNLGKENRMLVRSERQLRLELQRSVDARSKLEATIARMRAENDAMRTRLGTGGSRIPSAAAMRRVNSAFTPGTHHEPTTQRTAKGLRD